VSCLYNVYLEAIESFEEAEGLLEYVELELEANQHSQLQVRDRIRVAQAHLAKGLRVEEDEIRSALLSLRGQLNEEMRHGVALTSKRYSYSVGSPEAISVAGEEIASAKRVDHIRREIRNNESWLDGFMEADRSYLANLQEDLLRQEGLQSEHAQLLEQLSELSFELVSTKAKMDELFNRLALLRSNATLLINAFQLVMFRDEVSRWLELELPDFGSSSSEARNSILRIRERVIRKSAPLRYKLEENGMSYEDFAVFIEAQSSGLMSRDVTRHFLSSLSHACLDHLIARFAEKSV
jgi:hypothetical protein